MPVAHPTAQQLLAEVHDTADSVAPAGLTGDIAVQVLPFHDSATAVPVEPPPLEPTATQ